MDSCRHHEAEIQRLRAELAHERGRTERLEGLLLEALEASRIQAEAVVTLARDARSVTVTRDGVTGRVTLMGREEKKKQKGAERSANYRHRQKAKRHGELFERDATPSVTGSPPSPSSQGVGAGSLRVVTQAARHGVTPPPRVTKNPEQLPPAVRELRQAWNDQVVPHGFSAWGDTSSKLLEEAEAALQRRSLEEWRRVFSLVPRSNVCRGELTTRMRYTIVRVLGYTDKGDEVAACLLEGAWSIDDPPSEPKPEPCEVLDVAQLAPGPEGEAALATWQVVVEQIRAEGKFVTLTNFEKCDLAPVAVRDGALLLTSRDRYATAFVGETYGESLNKRVAGLGLEAGIIVTSPEGVQWPEEVDMPPEDESGAAPPG
jgi:hypothetical protein